MTERRHSLITLALGISTVVLALQNLAFRKTLNDETVSSAQRVSAGATVRSPSSPALTNTPAHAVNAQNIPDNDWMLQAEIDSRSELIEKKYALLLANLEFRVADVNQLAQLLAERERVLDFTAANAYTDPKKLQHLVDLQQQSIAHIDDRIRHLLPTDAAVVFDLIKDSNAEQQQLKEFSRQLQRDEALDQAQQRALLLVKLERRRDYEGVIQSHRYLAESGRQSDRRELLKLAQSGLQRYRDEYLHEAEKFLDQNQLAALQSYEAIQFETMESSLRSSLDID